MKKILATAAILTIVAAANATISASLEHWSGPGTLPSSGAAYDSWRLWVHVSDTDDWTAAGLDLGPLTGGTFYQDTFGSNPPNPALFPAFPDLEFDSYYTSPATYPNTGYVDPSPVGIASTADTPTQLDTDWFDTIDSLGGDFVIAQITVLAEGDYRADGLLQYSARESGGELFDFRFTIPEPGTLALLALGGLALIRRR